MLHRQSYCCTVGVQLEGASCLESKSPASPQCACTVSAKLDKCSVKSDPAFILRLKSLQHPCMASEHAAALHCACCMTWQESHACKQFKEQAAHAKLLTLNFWTATTRAYILVWYELIVQASSFIPMTRQMTHVLQRQCRELKLPDRGLVLDLT